VLTLLLLPQSACARRLTHATDEQTYSALTRKEQPLATLALPPVG
jgi:hypothetical protein